jgi:ribosomal protein S27AE
MVLKDVTVEYDACPYCGGSFHIKSYQPNMFVSLQVLKTRLKKNCNGCGATLGMICIKAKVSKKG